MTTKRTAKAIAVDMRQAIARLTLLMNEGREIGIVVNFSINAMDVVGPDGVPTKRFTDVTIIQKIEDL